MLKKLVVVPLILLIIVTFTSTGYSVGKLIPQPSDVKVEDKDVKWNPYKGEFYNKNDFVIDTVTGDYITVDKLQRKLDNAVNERKVKVTDKMKKTEVSLTDGANENIGDSVVDKAYLEYFNAKLKNPSNKAYYSVQDDEEIDILVNLGIDNLSEVLSTIGRENSSPKTSILMVTASEIIQAEELKNIDDTSNEGKAKWLRKLDDLKNDATLYVNELVQSIDSNADSVTISKAKKKVTDLGILAAPHIINYLELSNNSDMNEVLCQVLNESVIITKDSQKIKNKDYWIKWGEKNIDKINKLADH